jgi:uncharacterized protein (TIGR02246 family)
MSNHNSDLKTVFDAYVETIESTYANGDAPGMGEFYTEDGMLLATGADIIQGKNAIAGFWKSAMEMGIKTVRIEIVELDQQGDTVIDVGRYSLMSEDGQQLDHGKYLVVWKREGDGWKMHRDIFNSSVPQG